MRTAHLPFIGVLALFSLCLGAPPASAQNEAFETAEKVPPGIHFVSAGGFWTQGNEEGFFRVVVVAGGIEHVSHRLYLQWLRNDAKTQGYELIRTVNVKELNMGHGYVLTVKTDFGDINAFRVDVMANSRGGSPRKFAITAKGNGSYINQPR